jgi:ABC-2 type transport system ATP-binding protein
LHDPDVLILDEPTDGLDPNQKHHVRQLISEMSKDKAIVISTHVLEEVDAVCGRAIVIARGKMVADGTPAELEQRSSYFNAVSVCLHSDHIDGLRKALEGIGDIERIEITETRGDIEHAVVLPKDGATIIETVNARIKDRGIVIEQLYVERGRLEDVFRQITGAEQGQA